MFIGPAPSLPTYVQIGPATLQITEFSMPERLEDRTHVLSKVPELMAKLRATKTKYEEASKSLHEVEDIIEKMLVGFESWGWRDDTFQPFWMMLDRESSLYENTYRDKRGKFHTVRITKDGKLSVCQLTLRKE